MVQLICSAVVIILALAILTSSNSSTQYSYYTGLVILTSLYCMVFNILWMFAYKLGVKNIEPRIQDGLRSGLAPSPARLGWICAPADMPAVVDRQQREAMLCMVHAQAYERCA